MGISFLSALSSLCLHSKRLQSTEKSIFHSTRTPTPFLRHTVSQPNSVILLFILLGNPTLSTHTLHTYPHLTKLSAISPHSSLLVVRWLADPHHHLRLSIRLGSSDDLRRLFVALFAGVFVVASEQRMTMSRPQQDPQSGFLHEISSLLLKILRSPPPLVPFADHVLELSSAISSSSITFPSSQMSPAGFAALLLGISLALMLCGSVTFFLGFMLMPWILVFVMIFYMVGIVSSVSMLGRSILCCFTAPTPRKDFHGEFLFCLCFLVFIRFGFCFISLSESCCLKFDFTNICILSVCLNFLKASAFSYAKFVSICPLPCEVSCQ